MPSSDKTKSADSPEELSKEILAAMLDSCKNSTHVLTLVRRFPSVLHMKTTEGNLPLHIVARSTNFDAVESVIFLGMKVNVDGERGCGGLRRRNNRGISPIAMLSAYIYGTYSTPNAIQRDREMRVLSLIQKIAFQYMCMDRKKTGNGEEEMVDSPSQIPLLHAALTIGCPRNIINIIMDRHFTSAVTPGLKFQNKTPLQIAACNVSVDADIFLALLRWTPRAIVAQDAEGGFLLHQTIETGPRRRLGRYIGEVDFIGYIVEEAPGSLTVRDKVYGMFPFAMAANAGWSLGVIYGLLRANPLVLEDE